MIGLKYISAAMVALLLLMFSASAMAQTEDRISILYLHRSVGKSIVENCFDPRFGARNIREVLDTMNVTSGGLKANFVFRSGNLNGVPGPPITETTFTGNCAEVPIAWMYGGRSTKIWYNNSCPLLELFSDESKNEAISLGTLGEHAWDVFRNHQVYTDAGDLNARVWERYDLVIIKQPYLIWTDFTQERANMIKGWYRAIRDSVANHPEINFASSFGTPLCFEEPGNMDFQSDTSMAKIVYKLAIWFRDSLVNVPGAPSVPNFWAFDSYTPLCEAAAGAQNRYCLKDEYWGGPTSQSHLTAAGSARGQDDLLGLIRQATQSILSRRAGVVTRQDIDLKIKAFREGTATVQEVIDLINRYNSGQ